MRYQNSMKGGKADNRNRSTKAWKINMDTGKQFGPSGLALEQGCFMGLWPSQSHMAQCLERLSLAQHSPFANGKFNSSEQRTWSFHFAPHPANCVCSPLLRCIRQHTSPSALWIIRSSKPMGRIRCYSQPCVRISYCSF